MAPRNQLSLSIAPRGKPFRGLPSEISVAPAANTSQVYSIIASKTGASVNRIRITKGSDGTVLPNDPEKQVEAFGILDGSQLVVKDLVSKGPQLGWRFVYLVEYFGPLFIHPLMYHFRPYIYSNPAPLRSPGFPDPSDLQQLSLALIMAHYFKRELETIFVHRFSNATMPFRNIFKNCGHYWFLSGLFLGYFIYGPTAPTAASIDSNPLLAYAGIGLWLLGELGNANTHLVLKGLRSAGGKERGIPRGIGFGWVTCPNYMFEIISWIGMCLITRSWSTVVFSVVGAGQMAIWAKGKEKRYRKEFGDRYKKKRFAVLPGIY